jgi:hypothetical protein
MNLANDARYWEQYQQINCWYCGVRLYHSRDVFCWGEDDHKWEQYRVAPAGWKKFALDHALPSSKGGDNAEWNLVPACESCNCSKKNKTVQEFRQHKAKQSQNSAYFFWIEREIGEIITDILTEIQIEELEEEIDNDKRLMKDYQARASQKEAKVVNSEKKLRTLKASLGKSGVVPSHLTQKSKPQPCGRGKRT